VDLTGNSVTGTEFPRRKAAADKPLVAAESRCLSPNCHRLLTWAEAHLEGTIGLLREFVECESPSDDPAAIHRFNELFIARIAGMGEVSAFAGGHLRCRFHLPGAKRRKGPGGGPPNQPPPGGGHILALGHSDTVWPLGTLSRMPFRREQGRLWGPGVLDMKGGLAFLLMAVRALRDLDVPVRRHVLLQLNADEEVGSAGSRPLTEAAAKESVAVLVLEPGTGLEGKLKTARKGVGDYTVTVRGRASHAGIDFETGASAIVELARQIARIAAFTNIARGVTVNPGVISGGTRTNVVAEEARVEVDVRVSRLRDAAPLDRKFRALRPVDKRCSITVAGGLNRPPMERTPGNRRLFEQARSIAAAELGIALEESATGGGSDGNFTSALGVPTLDGLGTVGEGAHAANESILVDRIPGRVALLALLLARL
jgi:glutamate carboxypeptidase